MKWRGKRLVQVKTLQGNVGEERKRNGMNFLCCIIRILNLIYGKMGLYVQSCLWNYLKYQHRKFKK